jgi:hypothetical protein
MFTFRKHAILGSAALLAALPLMATENSGKTAAAVSPTGAQAHIKCSGATNVPMTSDVEQVLPLRLVRTLSCGENIALLDSQSYTAHVRTQEGQEGYVALIYISTSNPFAAAASAAPTTAVPIDGVVRWQAGAPGCDRLSNGGRVVESITADGVTVQVSLDDTGWKFRTSIAVFNGSASPANYATALITLDELQPGLKALHTEDARKLSGAKNHQILWTEANAQPSPSAVSNTPGVQAASYRTEDYFSSKKSRTLQAMALKSGAVEPGKKVAGVVFFERDANARELSLRVPVGNLIYDFPLSFDQKK